MTTGRFATVVLALLVAILSPGGAVEAQTPESRIGPRVLNGQPVTAAQFPWQAEIDIRDRFLCGGVLVSPTVVLTAAHCLIESRQPGDVAVSLGRSRTYRGGVTQSAAEVVINPAFRRHSLDGDWGFLVLPSPAPSSLTPIQIAGPDERSLWSPGRSATVTGYGTVREDGPVSRTLRSVRLPVLRDASCSRTRSYGARFDPTTMLCAGNPAAGKDSCQGDSGGPLVTRAADGTFRLVGLVSFGVGCAEKNYPGVYTRIAGAEVSAQLLARLDASPETAGYAYVAP